jgi:hypothetical protein
MQNIAKLLERKFKHYVRYNHAVEVLCKEWSDLMGDDIAKNIFPVNIYKNALVLKCCNPMWVSEIDYFKPKILDKINTLLRNKRIKIMVNDLKIVLVNAAEFKDAKPEGERNVPTSIHERIKWNDKQKRASGHTLCDKCHKILCKESMCRLCELTG